MKRVLVVSVLFLAVVGVPPVVPRVAHADTSNSPNCQVGGPGTYTCTLHGTNPTDLGPGCGFADVMVFGSGVFHVTVNKAGDSWITGTFQGPVVGLDSLGNTVMTGHGQLWFGVESNRQNGVHHFTANISGTLADGTHVGFHTNGDITMNANGQITASHMNFDCRG